MDKSSILLKSLSYVINEIYEHGIYIGLFNGEYLIFVKSEFVVNINDYFNELPTDKEFPFIKNAIENFNSANTKFLLISSIVTKESTKVSKYKYTYIIRVYRMYE